MTWIVVRHLMSSKDNLQHVLNRDIPLTSSLGVEIQTWDEGRLSLTLPLAPNINHKSTMFGGSLYCGAVLTGWGWLYLKLADAGIHDGHIVIQESQITYPRPVLADCLSVCELVEARIWDRFLSTYLRRGRARIGLDVTISNVGSDEVAVRFCGQYVVHK